MCTAVTYKTRDFYFGRTLDYEFSYAEEVTVMPRGYCLPMRHRPNFVTRYALVGMAYVLEEYPLYYDAVNEKGLCMAGLNFVGNACYGKCKARMDNITQFEFVPWILGQCESVEQARKLLKKLSLVDTPFSSELPISQLHWIVADSKEAITVEAMADGLHIYDNPVGVLTNNPPFDRQMLRLNDYMNLSPKEPENRFAAGLELKAYSRGMGAMGLPGDLSSASRFVRAAFVKMNSVSGESEAESVSQFFHILGAADQQRGCCEIAPGEYEITIYTSCCNASKGIYYYTTYDNRCITAVDMHRCDLDGSTLYRYPLVKTQQIVWQN